MKLNGRAGGTLADKRQLANAESDPAMRRSGRRAVDVVYCCYHDKIAGTGKRR